MRKPTDIGAPAGAEVKPSQSLAPSSDSVRTLDSQELLGSQGALYIRHQNEVYRLQTTRFGKLILTK